MEHRRTLIRLILFLVIVGTLPFYLLGFYLWGTAPMSESNNTAETLTPATATPSLTPINNIPTATNTLWPTWTPVMSYTPAPLWPTPYQYNPPVATATWAILPSATLAPTLTYYPTATIAPIQTNTNTPSPTNTEVIPPTNTVASETPFLPPTDTPTVETTVMPLP